MRRWMMAVALVYASGCGPSDADAPKRTAPEVTIAHPERMETADYADYTGTLEALESVEIRARVQGFLEKINFTPSSRVEKGQLLFQIEQAPFQTKLDFATAKLASSKADLALAEAQLSRRKDLAQRGAVTQEELDEAQAQREVSAAAVQEAEAAVEQSQIDLGYTSIHAPISGTIGRSLVDVGNLVGASEQTLLTSIVDTDQVYAYFEVSERDALEYFRDVLSRGDQRPTRGGNNPVKLGLLDEKGYPHEGNIDYVDNTFSAETGTIQVRGIFSNPTRILQPGMFVRVRIEGEKQERLLVKERAIAADLGGKYVLVVGKDNIVETVYIKPGQIVGDMRVVLPNEGLEEAEEEDEDIRQLTVDDWYIVNGLQRARPGLPVTPKQVSNSPPASQAPAQAEPAPNEPSSETSKPENAGS